MRQSCSFIQAGVLTAACLLLCAARQEDAAAPAPVALANFAFPGHNLRPLKGINYAPTPSDFTSYNQGALWRRTGVYPGTGGDFENANFAALWSSSGRNDLLDIKNLGVNAIRSYEYKGYYNHVPFLNYAQTLGLKVIVPLSNSEILAGSPSGGYIATTINEAKSSAANIAWGLSNELTYANGCNPVSKCFPALLAAAQEIANMDTSTRPIIITSIFDANFATAAAVRQAFYNAGLSSLYTSRVIQGVNMYFSESASLLPTILNNVLHSFYTSAALSTSPLIVTEYGRQSGSPYSASLQSDAVAAEAQTLKNFARNSTYPYFLGSFLFQYTDSNLNGGSSFGIKSYGSSSYQATGGSGAYKVDSLTNKPAYAAFKSAL